MEHRIMVADEDTPIGAPILPESRRDRLSVWIAEHPWVVPIIRLAGGLGLVAVAVLVLGVHLPLAKVIAFVIGVATGGHAGEHEKERGETLLEAMLSGGDLPAPPESLPSEFDEFFHQPPDPRMDPRYFGHR
jgi:hypothetical protein